jgi:hypothetical protein
VVFNPQRKEVPDSLLLQVPGVVGGRMSGYPAYPVGRKLFACDLREGSGIKVLSKESLVRAEKNYPLSAPGKKADERMDTD